LAVALAECAIAGGTGLRCALGAGLEAPGEGAASAMPGILFGETQSRFVVSCRAESSGELAGILNRHGVPHTALGSVGGDRINTEGVPDASLGDATAAHRAALTSG